ncbi:ABC transporter permease [Nocardioides aequoreus]|uniref:ABC transporter permease n=1 Tax=Nocardioides aequoreus TaxID=397278 RepID=UPI000A83EC60|nr:ABC transporter permease [Nocardioides aequoreus]
MSTAPTTSTATTAPTTVGARTGGLVNTTLLRLELRRVLRDRATIFFTTALPGFFYLIFGASQDYSDEPLGNGNVAMMIMVSMAAYGAVTATVSIGGAAALERMQGWGRQLGLTPLRDATYVVTKALVAVIVAAMPIALVFALGAVSGARADALAWVLSALVVLVGAAVFALYGLCFGLAFRSEAALSAASGSIVVLGFLGNIFVPLSGLLLDVARFTPLYGYVTLARHPVTEGLVVTGSDGTRTESIWIAVANVGGWTLLLAVLATLLVRRGRSRQ